MVSMKDTLHSRSTLFELIHPMSRVTPGSHVPKNTDANISNDVEEDGIDKEISNASTDLKKQASAYVSNVLPTKSQNRLKSHHILNRTW